MNKSKSSSNRLLTLVLLILTVANLGLMAWLGWPIVQERFQVFNNQSTPADPIANIEPTAFPTTEVNPEDLSMIQVSPAPVLSVESDPAANPGFIVLAMSDGQYIHLFAYHPETLPLTRLTNSNWDDIHPAVTVDGTKLAFSSHRNGFWDIYVMDLTNGNLTQVTNSPEYDGSPSWSPDGQWLAYESYIDGQMDIFIQNLADLSQPRIPLTNHPANDYSPNWSPEGREIAFVSTRTGEEEIWTAGLDRIDDRFRNISQNSGRPDTHPAWSPDGRYLAWSAPENQTQEIWVWDSQSPSNIPVSAGSGSWPAWSPTGNSILSGIQTANESALTAYENNTYRLAFPLTKLPGATWGLDWKNGRFPELIPPYFVENKPAEFSPLYARALSVSDVSPAGRYAMVEIPDITVPYPYLHDQVDEAFKALREEVARQSGWDFLSSLENAYLPITEPPYPGSVDEWLFTGRAFAVNPITIQAGWMTIVREDYAGQTYWRVYIKTRYQDGSQGLPLMTRPWDLDARFQSDPTAFEEGGKFSDIPAGYWIDFTELAARFGWERPPALINWRTYYQAARFNQFLMSDQLGWQAAMAQFYPPEAIKVPTAIPTFTVTPTFTPTPRTVRSATPQPAPTNQPSTVSGTPTP